MTEFTLVTELSDADLDAVSGGRRRSSGTEVDTGNSGAIRGNTINQGNIGVGVSANVALLAFRTRQSSNVTQNQSNNVSTGNSAFND